LVPGNFEGSVIDSTTIQGGDQMYSVKIQSFKEIILSVFLPALCTVVGSSVTSIHSKSAQ
jgi:hypothetical protein